MANYPWNAGAVLKVGRKERAFGSVETCTRSWAETLDASEQAVAVIETAKAVPDRNGASVEVLTSEDIEALADQLRPNMPAPDNGLHE